MTALQLEGVHAGFDAWGSPHHPVLHGFDLEVAQGERVGLVGPSGCGKTTAVRCALGLHPVRAGRVTVLGHELRSPQAFAPLRPQVQLLVQDPMSMLHPYVPVEVLLDDSVHVHRPELTRRARQQLVADLLRRVGLGARGGALPRELSGGERRRAGLARVLTARPRLLVADEPTAGLDAHLRMELLGLVDQEAGPDCAIVWVSHDVAALARVCDRIVCVAGGRVAARVAARDLLSGAARVDDPAALAHLTASGWRPKESP